jgi:hypothetical protein
MLVSFKDLLDIDGIQDDEKKQLLYHEILNSIPNNIIEGARGREEFNVQLMIDNQVVEPEILGDLLFNIGKYIEEISDAKIKSKIEHLDDQYEKIFGPLEEAVKTATQKIKDEFK